MGLPCRGSTSVTCTRGMPVISVRLWHSKRMRQYAATWLKPCSERRQEGCSNWHTRALRWRSTWRACTWRKSMKQIYSKKLQRRRLHKIETTLRLDDRAPSMQPSYSKETTLHTSSASAMRSARTSRGTMAKKSLFLQRLLRRTSRRACSMPKERHQVMKTRAPKTEECLRLVSALSNVIYDTAQCFLIQTNWLTIS